MKQAVMYRRVSTGRQGRSGLGLAAQKKIVRHYCQTHHIKLVREFVEVASGRNNKRPKVLQAIRYYADLDRCQEILVEARWPNGVTCPTCGGTRVSYLATQKRWQCYGKHPRRQFSVKVGTIFEDSPIKLDKWFTAIWLIGPALHPLSAIVERMRKTKQTSLYLEKLGPFFIGRAEGTQNYVCLPSGCRRRVDVLRTGQTWLRSMSSRGCGSRYSCPAR